MPGTEWKGYIGESLFFVFRTLHNPHPGTYNELWDMPTLVTHACKHCFAFATTGKLKTGKALTGGETLCVT